jgi:hypothetical protein
VVVQLFSLLDGLIFIDDTLSYSTPSSNKYVVVNEKSVK